MERELTAYFRLTGLYSIATPSCLPSACRLPTGRQGRQGRQVGRFAAFWRTAPAATAADPFYYRNRFTPAVFDKQGGGATLAYYQSNPAQTKDWELQKIQKPDWSQILLPPKQPVMSEDEYVAAIKEQARNDFAAGACANTESFSNLWKTYVSEVSPDRQAIYAESMQKTGGYMNLGAAFFADDGQMVMMYSRDEQMGKNQNMNVMTEEEWARSRKFYDLYRGEMAAQSQNSASSPSGARLDIDIEIKDSVSVNVTA